MLLVGRDGEGVGERYHLMPPIHALLETALYVADPTTSANFYRHVFNLQTLLESEKLIALDVAGHNVLLLFKQGATRESATLPGGVIPAHGTTGVSHFAFAIDAADLDACVRPPRRQQRNNRKRSCLARRRPQPLLPRRRQPPRRTHHARLLADILTHRRRWWYRRHSHLPRNNRNASNAGHQRPASGLKRPAIRHNQPAIGRSANTSHTRREPESRKMCRENTAHAAVEPAACCPLPRVCGHR